MTINKHTHPPINRLSWRDQCLSHLQMGLSTVFGKPTASRLPYKHSDTIFNRLTLTEEEKKQSGRLMRVNAVGEICAQGLYLGQALTSRSPEIKEHMLAAAYEEIDHLAWCNRRLNALGTHPSYLNPLWYLWSVMLGMGMGFMGDHLSLGFVIETEKQVMAHIKQHLAKLPAADKESAATLRQMYIDECSHATAALEAGGITLPFWIKCSMRFMSKVMTTTAHYF